MIALLAAALFSTRSPKPGGAECRALCVSRDTVVSERTDDYELYAATPALLESSRPELQFAARTFRRYFGPDLVKIAVVVVRSPAELQAYDMRALRARGLAVVPWMAASAIPNVSSSALALAVVQQLGLVLRQAGDSVIVRATLPGAGADVATGDIVTGLQGHPLRRAADAQGIVGGLAVGDSITLDLIRDGQQRHTTVTVRAASAAVRVEQQSSGSGAGAGHDDTAGQLDEHHALSHEACHQYLIAYANHELDVEHRRPATSELAYGHPALPDWVDEAVATLCEHPDMQAVRLRGLRRDQAHLLPLTRLFSMEHPVFTMLKASGAVGSAMSAGGTTVRQITLPSGGLGTEPILFYAQSLSVSQYLVSRAGDLVMKRLVDSLLHGATVETALRAERDLPHSVDALDAAWRESLRTPTPS